VLADSFGYHLDARVSQAGGLTIRTGTAQAGSTATTLKLDSGASSVDDFYKDTLILLTSGTGAGQARKVLSYTGSSKVAQLTRRWLVTPDATSVFRVHGDGSRVDREVED
jgi:hypothetical protein